MPFHGRVSGGVVVLDDPGCLADGEEVRVEPIAADTAKDSDADVPTLYDRLEPFIGTVSGLPPDLAENHDHYLHRASAVSA